MPLIARRPAKMGRPKKRGPKVATWTLSSLSSEHAEIKRFSKRLSFKTPMDLFRSLLRSLNHADLLKAIQPPNYRKAER